MFALRSGKVEKNGEEKKRLGGKEAYQQHE